MSDPRTPKPWYLKWWVWVIAAVLVVGGIGYAVSGGEEPEPAASTAPQPTAEPEASEEPAPAERTEVDWSTLPTSYQQIVDEETAEQDCAALQDMFDTAPDQADVLMYIDEALTIAGCYD